MSKRIGVFIDGSNLQYAKLVRGKKVNWKAFYELIETWGQVVAVYYYVATPLPDPEKLGNVDRAKNFQITVASFGFRVRTKEVRPVYDAGEIVRHKANFDVEIAVDMMNLVHSRAVHEVYLVSSDSDFDYLLRKVQDSPYGVRTVVVGPREGTPRELKFAADQFIPLDDMVGKVIRELRTRERKSTDSETDLPENGLTVDPGVSSPDTEITPDSPDSDSAETPTEIPEE